MITVNNVELRNLQEQVLKNKQDIAKHYDLDRVMADFGIKVVGKFDYASELPDPATYVGDYGNTYAVGTQAPYNFYIWTRADANAGQPEDYWFPYGELSIVGPTGPQGNPGPRGPAGVSPKIYTGNSPQPSADGDLYINTTNGNLYQTTSGALVLVGNIMGPAGAQGKQGIQGKQGVQGPAGAPGPRGDVGGLVNLVGIVNNSDALPNPTTINNVTYAYLVGTEKPYTLYVQVGETPATSTWMNMGPLNTATLVEVEGEFQNLWNADTKVDKADPEELDTVSVYGVNPEIGDVVIPVSTEADQNTIARRTGSGTIEVATPTGGTEAVNKAYADTAYAPRTPAGGLNNKVWLASANSGSWWPVSQSGQNISNGTIATYVTNTTSVSDPSHVLISGYPYKNNHVATKAYVDSKVSSSGGVQYAQYELRAIWYVEEDDAEDELVFVKYTLEGLSDQPDQYVGIVDADYGRYLLKRAYWSGEIYIEDLDTGTGQYIKDWYTQISEY